ncbi:hypothetical protein Hanom_Chr07g00648421 [Helianthus anomalus]
MGVPSPLKPTPMGYGGAWIGGMSFLWPLESLPCHLLARPTPGFKPTLMGPRPNSHPNPSPRVVTWAFSPNPRPMPHGLMNIFFKYMI